MTTLDTAETPETKLGRDTVADIRGVERLAPAPRLIVVLDCQRPTVPGSRLMLDGLDEVLVARNSVGRIARAGRTATLFIADLKASRQHLAIRQSIQPTSSGWDIEDLGSKNGTLVNGEPVERARLSHGDVIEVGGTLLLFLQDDAPYSAQDRELCAPTGPTSAFETLSVTLERRIQEVTKIAISMVPVLVRGETGTGKELMARAIHDASGRQGAFIPVNCGALPRDLVESELFGHRRGAFSGATEEREGLVRRAHRGTLFLDEIAELPPESQVALLRVLQEGEVRPVGASKAVNVDIRVVTATHQDLGRRIADGRFRRDLYGRIAGFEVRLPALRDRREDLGMLIASVVSRECPDPQRVTIHKAAARALFRHAWPLNIRELEQTLRAALGLCEGGEIRLEHLPEALRGSSPGVDTTMSPKDRALRERLVELLRGAGGNVAAVGRAMDRAPIQVRRWCRRLRIDLTQFRP